VKESKVSSKIRVKGFVFCSLYHDMPFSDTPPVCEIKCAHLIIVIKVIIKTKKVRSCCANFLVHFFQSHAVSNQISKNLRT
jgi:hypothetical protein